MRTLLTSLLLVAGFCTVYAADPGGGIAALEALPVQYRDGVLKLSADNGVPNPKTWYVVAKNSRQKGAMYQVAISQGQVISEKISLDLRAAIKDSSIDMSKVLVDSDGVWAAGAKYSAGKGRKLANASYALQQQGRDAAPIWSIWCYDANVKYIGLVKVLATTGDVISSE